MPWAKEVPLPLQSFSTVRRQWHWVPHGKHRDGSCQQWHRFDPPPGRSMTVQCHFDSELVLTSSVASEAEMCWRLQGADAVAVGLLVRELGAQGVGAPNKRRAMFTSNTTERAFLRARTLRHSRDHLLKSLYYQEFRELPYHTTFGKFYLLICNQSYPQQWC